MGVRVETVDGPQGEAPPSVQVIVIAHRISAGDIGDIIPANTSNQAIMT